MKSRATAKTSATNKTRVTAKTLAMVKTRVTATEAARKFSEILNRVAYKGESFVVERGGRPVCEISPAAKSKKFTGADFLELIRTVPRPDDQYFEDVEEIVRNRQPVAPSPWRR